MLTNRPHQYVNCRVNSYYDFLLKIGALVYYVPCEVLVLHTIANRILQRNRNIVQHRDKKSLYTARERNGKIYRCRPIHVPIPSRSRPVYCDLNRPNGIDENNNWTCITELTVFLSIQNCLLTVLNLISVISCFYHVQSNK